MKSYFRLDYRTRDRRSKSIQERLDAEPRLDRLGQKLVTTEQENEGLSLDQYAQIAQNAQNKEHALHTATYQRLCRPVLQSLDAELLWARQPNKRPKSKPKIDRLGQKTMTTEQDTESAKSGLVRLEKSFVTLEPYLENIGKRTSYRRELFGYQEYS